MNFQALSEIEQARFLAHFAHSLTIDARAGYEIGTEGLTHPELLRRLNEVQHRLQGAILARLSANTARIPDDVLVAMMVRVSPWAFRRACEYCGLESPSGSET